ncbi:2-dehydro-3-deoxyphosphogluconate aldolase/(4S)-4-hydroxy-2-oxoglutarate aldolase [Anseongella ginsenosidimutans]|uniref:2-dehydro-3-deoxyphosphogluconate aldolase/(4S)-4-hydroxy-2-oxoglutarate aldolase n=1 Tax=Anseongella ginsenosidimutans TaxID=496056 RepID=A0A4R3KRN5_9SPHI|nr:bifunctional 4-hydroxy-2-oxoglutarate aldolase/2-dehydro-3-deoxy-phosphogluconate aldolase [Anseongella ginsenosidimutans]QEC52247.1 bifunctional 4-hydroxy-2-oxoglutarate aldolase/2-dehydro-3-deoxy-phosphogluconate aldolase [Anseongella ginsenosidimutans]TCS86799.1 2-dehydro-3-deoxyphosphogluconate aldolase/(4S)-4-hydroxy-2-oxoglutarate aldolase [Anseongella ginsenosidimutans]
MARFSRLEVYGALHATKFVPLFYNEDPETCKEVFRACYRGGVRVIEYTNRGDFAHEIFAELSRFVKKELPDLVFGAGTIMDAPTAALYIQMGADFIVAPVIKSDVALLCNRRKIAWMPGASTMTEISSAEELGAEVVKLFPANILGPDFIKALKGPMPWTSILVTGGVEPTRENLTKWFKAGAACVGMGSSLFPKELIRNKDWDQLEDTARSALEIIQSIK